MFFVVKIAGQQYKVEKGQKLYVPHLEAKIGEVLTVGEVLLSADESNVILKDNKKVNAEVINQVKGDKVIAFKKKRRKGFKKKLGHRTQYTQILIKDII
ncbi:MAG: 50S ribosomal protein L21 [Chitinophagaceae bacterium]